MKLNQEEQKGKNKVKITATTKVTENSERKAITAFTIHKPPNLQYAQVRLASLYYLYHTRSTTNQMQVWCIFFSAFVIFDSVANCFFIQAFPFQLLIAMRLLLLLCAQWILFHLVKIGRSDKFFRKRDLSFENVNTEGWKPYVILNILHHNSKP